MNRVSVTSAHIGDMNILRMTQIALLAAAFILGVAAPVFNGLSILALVLAVTPLVIGYHRGREGSEAP